MSDAAPMIVQDAPADTGPIDVARFYYDQRFRIREDAAVLGALMDAVNYPNDLSPAGWAQWYSVALAFKPDLILELGRGCGNSTAIFCQAASRLPGTRVVSVCNSVVWAEETVPRLRKVVPAGWFDPLEAHVVDIMDVDFEHLIGDAARVLFLWDAHGFQIAEVVLGRILPLLASREHLVVMHDITDTRHSEEPDSYEGKPLWKGSRVPGAAAAARVNIGWMNSHQEQVVAIADFSARNGLEIGSADHEYAQFFGSRPQAAEEMRQELGDAMFSLSAHWAFFTLAGKTTLHFPPVPEAPRTLAIDIARSYFDQRFLIHDEAAVLGSLMNAVNWPNDLAPAGWTQWYGVALAFKPDLILELGRGYGNSTAIFCQAASRLPGTRVVSVCNSKEWDELTLPRLRKVVPPEWFDPLDAHVTDILDVDFEPLIGDARRVLFLWDAHGFQIAEVVLGRILPLLAGREHLVIMHDITDTRHSGVPESYEGGPIWKGSTFPRAAGTAPARVNIGWMNSEQDQVVAIADFSARNNLEIGSADHEYAQFFDGRPWAAEEMHRQLGTLFSVSAHWAFFTLAGKTPLHFPTVPPRLTAAEAFEAGADVVHEVAADFEVIFPPPRRWFRRPSRLPRTITTSTVAWRYASIMSVRPLEKIPDDVNRAIRVRVRVESAPAGVSVLTLDRSAFIQARCVLPSADTQTILLPLDTRSEIGPLVVHTWDSPRSARVHVEEIVFVWRGSDAGPKACAPSP